MEAVCATFQGDAAWLLGGWVDGGVSILHAGGHGSILHAGRKGSSRIGTTNLAAAADWCRAGVIFARLWRRAGWGGEIVAVDAGAAAHCALYPDATWAAGDSIGDLLQLTIDACGSGLEGSAPIAGARLRLRGRALRSEFSPGFRCRCGRACDQTYPNQNQRWLSSTFPRCWEN